MLVAELWCCTWGRGRVGAMAPASLSSGFQSFTLLPTIKLGPSGAGSRVGGPVHTLGPCGSLQWPLLWGWESLLLPPENPKAFSIRGLRLYFPALEPWVARSASLPAVRVYLRECGAAGSASGQTASPVCPTLRQSRSRHSHASPLCPGGHLCPSYRSGWMFIFYLLGVGPPCRSIFCHFWLCEEVQCVHLHRHLGSSVIYFQNLVIL